LNIAYLGPHPELADCTIMHDYASTCRGIIIPLPAQSGA
jgi:hypothetical protein